jgi:alkanesulfonate monooxygenase SsuD/methylene tetrahydromethanopterin reductase-like flavin-dependent oxidoreductase (luciferase family)
MPGPIEVGIVLREQDLSVWSGRLQELAERSVAAGVDHLTVGDHVSFADGHGADGLIQAAALLSAHPSVAVQTGVYLLALRHPAIVARQLATIALLAPGRFTFGIGVGGDDPSELELCGINPRERGARTTEALRVSGCSLKPKKSTSGAASSNCTARSAQHRGRRSRSSWAAGRTRLSRAPGSSGDGWLALWVSPRRFVEAVGRIEDAAAQAGRAEVPWSHALQLWAGFDASAVRARDRLATAMQAAYALPFERFERYAPCGAPDVVAEALAPYLAVGCRTFNFVREAESLEVALEAAAEVKAVLSGGNR